MAFIGIPGLDMLESLFTNTSFAVIFSLAIRAALVGAAGALIRILYKRLASWFMLTVWPDSYISEKEPAFLWVSAFLARDPAVQAQLKGFRLAAADSRQAQRDNQEGALRGKKPNNNRGNMPKATEVGLQDSTWSTKKVIAQLLPTFNQTVKLHHNGNTIWITRKMYGFARIDSYHKEDHLEIRTWGHQKTAIRDFVVDCHEAYFAKVDQEILIFHAARFNASWMDPVSRPSRPWSSVILPEEKKNGIAQDIDRFLSDKEVAWYAARGIPHRRGYLFHGAPGAGKTTLATALASQLRLDIYVLNPAQRGMDDAKLNKTFRDVPPSSIILIEDIDCVMPKRRGGKSGKKEENDDDESEEEDTPTPEVSASGGGNHNLAPSTVTLSGLLNAIDGVSSQEGCILIASTNHPEKLDPALCRAGRFDVNVEFFDATPAQAEALFKHFYPLAEFSQNDSLAVQPTIKDDVNDEKPAQDQNQDQDQEKGQKSVQGLSREQNRASASIKTQEDLDHLSSSFAASVFPPSLTTEAGNKTNLPSWARISMAALQGYLLQYKHDPFGAVTNATEWSATIKAKQDEVVAEKERRKAARLAARKEGEKEKEIEEPLTPVSAGSPVAAWNGDES